MLLLNLSCSMHTRKKNYLNTIFPPEVQQQVIRCVCISIWKCRFSFRFYLFVLHYFLERFVKLWLWFLFGSCGHFEKRWRNKVESSLPRAVINTFRITDHSICSLCWFWLITVRAKEWEALEVWNACMSLTKRKHNMEPIISALCPRLTLHIKLTL